MDNAETAINHINELCFQKIALRYGDMMIWCTVWLKLSVFKEPVLKFCSKDSAYAALVAIRSAIFSGIFKEK